jgi:hypothetical protein
MNQPVIRLQVLTTSQSALLELGNGERLRFGACSTKAALLNRLGKGLPNGSQS